MFFFHFVSLGLGLLCRQCVNCTGAFFPPVLFVWCFFTFCLFCFCFVFCLIRVRVSELSVRRSIVIASQPDCVGVCDVDNECCAMFCVCFVAGELLLNVRIALCCIFVCLFVFFVFHLIIRVRVMPLVCLIVLALFSPVLFGCMCLFR